MLPDRVSNPGPLTYESGALLIALRGPALFCFVFVFFVNVFLCVFKTVSTQLNLFVCNILSKRTLKHRP